MSCFFCEIKPIKTKSLCIYNLMIKNGAGMNSDIDKLADVLGLSTYQRNVLKSNPDIYNLSRLIKRGSALYAPRNISSYKFINFLFGVFFGNHADLIGKNKMLVRNTRGIEFRARGFYSAPVGRQYRYYADDCGNIITRDDFFREISRE